MNLRTAPDAEWLAPLRPDRASSDGPPDQPDQQLDQQLDQQPAGPPDDPEDAGHVVSRPSRTRRTAARLARAAAAGRRRVPSARTGVLVLAAVLGAVAGSQVPALLPVTSQATTSVLLHPLDGNPYSPSTQGSDLVNLETEAQVARSDAIVAAVEDQLGGELSREQLGSGLAVSVGTNTQVVDLTFRAADPGTAREVAELFAASFLVHRSAQRDAFLAGRQGALDTRIQELALQLKELRDAEVSNLDPEIKAIGGQLLNLRLQSASIAAADVSPGQVIVDAQSQPSGLRVPWWLTALLGLGLGLGLAWLGLRRHEQRADLVGGAAEVEDLGLLVLADERELVDTESSPGARATGFVLRRRPHDDTTVAIAPVGAGSAGDLPGDLAGLIAEERSGPVLLVSGRGTDRSRDGLSEVLLRERALASVVTADPHGSGRGAVVRMTLGRQPGQAEGLFASSRMTRVLDEASERYAAVVIDGPDVANPAGRALVAGCTYWVPVLVPGQTTRRDLLRALSWADAAGVTVLGCVLVRPAEHRADVVAPGTGTAAAGA